MWSVALLLLFASLGLRAAELDAAAQARVQHLSEILRCVVCQNQTLADSQAELAQDIKRELHAQVLAGASDEAVLAFMVQRYGDFVLYRPPLKPSTWALWFGPLLLLGLGGGWLYRVLAKQRRSTAGPLNEELSR
jgi:cytochrome c-type biogenesis protein CcmH